MNIGWSTGLVASASIFCRLGIITDPPLERPIIGELQPPVTVVFWALSGYITGYKMAETAQIRAIKRYRKRLAENGIARFEVLGLKSDRELIRTLAKRLAAKDAEAVRIRNTIRGAVSSDSPQKGGIFRALRRSPLVGADIKSARSTADDRKARL